MLSRSTRELDEAKRKEIFEAAERPSRRVDVGRLEHFEWAPPVTVFMIGTLVIGAFDALIAHWVEAEPYLGYDGSLVLAAMLTFPIIVYMRRRLVAVPPPAIDPGGLAAALERELEIGGDTTIRIERLEIRVVRARGVYDDTRLRVLILGCGEENWVFVREPTLVAHAFGDRPDVVPRRWAIEVLRWTRVISSLANRGSTVPVQRLDLDEAVFESLGECEVRTTSELPEEVAVQLVAPPA